MANARAALCLVSLAFLMALSGCNAKEREAYDNAYKANYPVGYEAGYKEGEERGRKEGRERGAEEARAAAQSGGDWRLYARLALLALAVGLALGLLVQYSVLLACRRYERVPQFSTVAFVPAMKLSLAYSIFERRRRVLVEVEEELREMGERRNLQVAQIKEVHDAVERKLKAVSSLEELTQARIVELAAEEFDRIISAAAEKAERMKEDAARRALSGHHVAYACPHCQQIVRYAERFAGQSVNCPNQACGRSIKLPPMFTGGDGSPVIFDVTEA